MAKPGLAFNLALLERRGDETALLALLIDTLRAGVVDANACESIADMLDVKGKSAFRLHLKRRPGNRGQRDSEWLSRLAAFDEIYSEAASDKDALDLAELPIADGGLGVSRVTAQKYLATLKDLRAVEDDSQPK
jgi:hypothetical protein